MKVLSRVIILCLSILFINGCSDIFDNETNQNNPANSGNNNGNNNGNNGNNGGGNNNKPIVALTPLQPAKRNFQGFVDPSNIGSSLFKSHLYYGRSLFKTEEEKRAFDHIIDITLSGKGQDLKDTWIEIDFQSQGINVTEDQVINIMKYLVQDEPRFNLITSTYLPCRSRNIRDKLQVGNHSIIPRIYLEPFIKGMNVEGTYNMYRNHMAEMEVNIQQVLSVIREDMTELQIVRAVHDKFLATVAYGTMNSRGDGNLRGAFLDTNNNQGIRRVVCQGYAVAFQYLMMRLNIPCIYVVGTGIVSPGTDIVGDHAWNKVKVKGGWYGVDPTHNDSMIWNSANAKHDFFLKNDATMFIERTEGVNSAKDKVGYETYPPSPENSIPLEDTEYPNQ